MTGLQVQPFIPTAEDKRLFEQANAAVRHYLNRRYRQAADEYLKVLLQQTVQSTLTQASSMPGSTSCMKKCGIRWANLVINEL